VHFPEFPMRQVHLDFHTSPDIPDVGADWDADHFVATLQEARVNLIILSCSHFNISKETISPRYCQIFSMQNAEQCCLMGTI